LGANISLSVNTILTNIGSIRLQDAGDIFIGNSALLNNTSSVEITFEGYGSGVAVSGGWL